MTDASKTGDGVVGTDTTCDSATLSGSFNGTGTITFSLTAPDNSTKQIGLPVTVSGDDTYQSPSCPLLTEVGTYTWSASYSGDDLNNGARKPVEIRFYGQDTRTLLGITNAYMEKMRKVPGAVDVGLSENTPKDELKIEFEILTK